uniref:Uncharacterized protein n=1 Tax=Kalanchoe fedtschenkoi TaxID=63787 RepID=A0A7N1A315_KALFE
MILKIPATIISTMVLFPASSPTLVPYGSQNQKMICDDTELSPTINIISLGNNLSAKHIFIPGASAIL